MGDKDKSGSISVTVSGGLLKLLEEVWDRNRNSPENCTLRSKYDYARKMLSEGLIQQKEEMRGSYDD